MKKSPRFTSLLPALGAVCCLVLSACGPEAAPGSAGVEKTADTAAPAEDETPLSGTFSVDGKSYTGKVSVQKFPATGQYSVVCQDDAFGFVQITFANEADARKAQTVQLAEMSYTKANDPGTAHLSLSPFSGGETGSKEASKATATITKDGAHTVVSFEAVELSSNTSDVKKVVSGKVMY